jgi:hypothetical protein
MANTYTLISSNTVGASSVSSVTFSSIPSTYTDLILKWAGRVDGTNDQTWISFNGSTSNFTNKVLYGNGSSAASTSIDRYLGYHDPTVTNSGSIWGNAEIYIPNYAGSTNKSLSSDSVWENNEAAAYVALSTNLWSNTAAITSITLSPAAGNYVQYSSFYLYGVKNA